MWLGVGFRSLFVVPNLSSGAATIERRADRSRRPRAIGTGFAHETAVAAAKYHRPVLVEAVLEHLEPAPGGTFLDGTVGGGGHAEAILDAGPDVRLVGIDRDPDALAAAGARLARFGERVRLYRSDYADVAKIDLGEGTLAGVLLDLGVSSHQIDSFDRGFTFRPGAPLDMRMSGEHGGETAADLLNTTSRDRLVDLFRNYAEERRAGRLASEIVRRRESRPFRTSDDLLQAIEAALGRPPSINDRARIFQALRIAINRELESLERALPSLRDLLRPGGRMVVISYHSLEDRIVKRAFRDWSRSCVCPPDFPVCRCRGRPLGTSRTTRPVRPSAEEVDRNPRARSARLRAWEKAE